DEGEAGERGEPLARDAGPQVDSGEVDWYVANRADAVQAEGDIPFGRDLFEARQVVEHARRGLTMDGPDPADLRIAFQRPAQLGEGQRFPPAGGELAEGQPPALRLGREPGPELAVDEDDAAAGEERELGRHGLV